MKHHIIIKKNTEVHYHTNATTYNELRNWVATLSNKDGEYLWNGDIVDSLTANSLFSKQRMHYYFKMPPDYTHPLLGRIVGWCVDASNVKHMAIEKNSSRL